MVRWTTTIITITTTTTTTITITIIVIIIIQHKYKPKYKCSYKCYLYLNNSAKPWALGASPMCEALQQPAGFSGWLS